MLWEVTPRSLSLLGRKTVAAALAAALALSGSGPIYAQEIRAIAGRGELGGRAGEAGVPALPNVLSPLSPPAFNGALTPTSSALPGPSISPSAAVLGGHARALPALAAPSLLPAVAVAEPVPAPGAAKTPVKSGEAAVLPAETADGDAKDFADAEFHRLNGEVDAAVSGEAAPVAAAPAPVPAESSSDPSRDGSVDILSVPPAPEIDKPEPPAAEPDFFSPREPIKYVYEDFLGFRAVRGVRHDPTLKPLLRIESIDQVIDHISRQFDIPRARILELGAKYRLNEYSPLASWVSVYDRLQASNRDQFKRLDAKKYHTWIDEEPVRYPAGWDGVKARFGALRDGLRPASIARRVGEHLAREKATFRMLANKTYKPGWRGTMQRASRLHVHFIGAAFRFPYHLFDMFIFGYFRQAISFEHRHSGEDFFALSDREKFAEQWLEAAMHQDWVKGAGAFSGIRANRWYRGANHWFIVPFAAPLTTFVARRLTLAVMSMIAMGFLGALSPFLPLSFAITPIPVVGPAIVAVLNGLPVAVAVVPWLGPVLAPVVAAATTALARDLILGPLMNTLILSTLLTYPAAAREAVARLRDEAPLAHMPMGGMVMAVLGAAVSWQFWSSNLKSFLGLATVGAEIQAIMTYAGSIDAGIDPGFKAVFGREIHLFHGVAGAVELPAGESVIRFGGAITWGNVLLYKMQTLAGFNISNAVMNSTLLVKGMIFGESATDLPMAKSSAQELIAASSARTKDQGLPFDPNLWMKPLSEAKARIVELAGKAGHLDAEIAAVKEHRTKLWAELGDKRAQIERLQALSRPVTDAERAEQARLIAALAAKSDEVGVREKLAERRDLLQPPSDADALARLKALQKEFTGKMPPPPPDRNGYWEDLAAQDASMKALSQRLETYAEGKVPSPPGGEVAPALTAGARDQIARLVADIEALRAEAKGELAERDAASALLSASSRLRNAALRARNPSVMIPFHTDKAKLSSVMALALSLNEINAAQTAIAQMTDLVESKRAKISASRAENQRSQNSADQNAGLNATWKGEVDQDIADDDSTLKDIAESKTKVSLVVERLGAFKTDLRAFIDSVNAEDRGESADAATEYQRRIELLPQIKAWRENGGNPNDPDAFSLKKFTDDLAEIDDNITKAADGLVRLPTSPDELAGTVMAKVPGPEVSLSNPSQERMRQVLAERKVYWQGKRADFGKSLDTVNRMLDAGNGRTVLDEFGDPHPESLPLWRERSQSEMAAAQAAARSDLSQLDALAANINRASGSSLPMLAGLGLKELQDAIKTYGDNLKAVTFSETESLQSHTAMMDLVSSARLVPQAAREIIRWSKADATVTAIDDAALNILPKAKTGLEGIAHMLDVVLSDVILDEAWNQNPPPRGEPGKAQRQGLIDRKTALLRDTILPALRGARAMLVDTLIPYQRKSIEDMNAASSDYFKLYDSKKTLIEEADKLYNHTMPWTFATFGAADGDQAEARQKIGEWRHRLQKRLDGYDDAKGHHKGVHEYQVEAANRKDPNFSGTEDLYGETQPFSLPKKIEQYTAERKLRAEQVNAQDAQINEIIGKIETISKGKYAMSSFRLPVGVTPDAAGVSRAQAAVDGRAVQNLVDRLKAVADESQAGVAAISIGGDGTVPSGPQPAIAISENQQISLLALDAAKRLVPTSLNQPETAPAAFALARLLYSDAVIAAAQDGLHVQLPEAERFLGRVSTVLGEAIADISNDEDYAAKNGASETAEQVFARKIRVYSSLDGVLLEAADFFRLKQGWSRDKFATLDRVRDYYDALHDIYSGGQTANDNEVEALDKMQDALRLTMSDLEQKRVKVSSWLNQLNPRQKSALNSASEDVSQIMDKTRDALETNIDWHVLEDRLGRSREILQSQLTQIEDKQNELAAILAKPEAQGRLPADLARRVEALRLGRSGWVNEGSSAAPASLVIRKAEYGAFVDSLLGLVASGAPRSAAEMSALKADLLKNPQSLASLVPNSKVLELGDAADGFYLVYQSGFAVPHGLNTNSWATLGNIGKVFGSNVSVSGYKISSPPSKDGENAPYGDKGVDIQVESLQGKNSVNYLNVDLHRFAFDIPADNSVKAGAGESRLMIFNDHAYMSDGKDLYVGLAGFADGALQDTKDKPYYYGGNAKTSVKMTKVMTLDAEQRALWATDPRKFLQDVPLNFTGYDPDLRNFTITASGEKKDYFRTQVGPKFDLNRLMNPDGGGEAFTLDLYWAKTAGTDDVNQQAAGVSLLKGFSLKNSEGKTWMRIDNRATVEAGPKQTETFDRLAVSFPDSGLVVSGEGRIIGGARTYFGQIAKKMGDHSDISLSYGSQYMGMNDRLSIGMNNSFTLAELWQKVSDDTALNLSGGETLKGYNREFGDFFSGDEAKSSRTAMELLKVYERDIGLKLVSQDIGGMTSEIQQWRKAGAFMENSRVRGMVGFTSRPVSNDLTERAVGGGLTVGSYSEMSMSKTQKQFIETHVQALSREGLRLQDRMLSLTIDWQAAIVELAQAQWALKMADFSVQNAPSEASRREAAVSRVEAESRLHQAALRYNGLTGRDPQAPPPFADLNAEDLRQMLGSISRLLASPDRLGAILGGLDGEALKKSIGENPFNLVDWIPWVDRLTIGFGVQFQDMMANQVLTVGGSLRVPIYDPASKRTDKAYALEAQAVKEEMKQAYAERTSASRAAAEQAVLWEASARAIEPNAPAAARALSDAIRASRNGLIGPEKLRAAFAAWNWYLSTSLDALSRAALLRASASVQVPFERPARNDGSPLRLSSIDDAFAAASANSHNLGEIAKHQEAAEEMARAADRRIQKAWVDVGVGVGLTAQGVGWLPSLGATGISVIPTLGFELKPEEMRELQVTDHERQTDYYGALKNRVESGLAVQFYQNMAALRSAQSRLAIYDDRLLPELGSAAAAGGADAVRRYDEAKLAREATSLEFAKARETINFLLGRPAEATITVEIDERQALVALSRLLAAKDPVATQRRILDARVSVAKAVEEMIDKNMKVETLQMDLNIVVRAFGRLLAGQSNGPIYNNPEMAAAARIQTLTEERERDAYDARRETEAAQLGLRLNAVRDAWDRVRATDPESLIEKSRLASEMFTLQAGLLALGANPDAAIAVNHGTLPKSWAELKGRLAASEQSRMTAASEDRLDWIAPENLKNRSGVFARYDFAHQTMGHEPIGRSFIESWIELRLNDPGTPPEALLALAKLRTDKADRLHRDALAGAAARADIAAARFEGDARLLRYLEGEIAGRNAAQSPKPLDDAKLSLKKRLEVERQELVARLGLSPQTTLDDLLRLVGNDAESARNLPELSSRLIEDIRARQIDSIRRTLFDGGAPAGWGGEQDLMGRIKADAIAERMRYNGFTPVATFGYFRGTPIAGGFIEAPDPREVEVGLEKAMGEVLRKQMQSSGQFQAVTLRIHSLLVGVADGTKSIEARRKLIEAAENDLRARAETSGPGSVEYAAAQDALLSAWDGFARVMTSTKADFIALVTELEAFGEGSAGAFTLRPVSASDRSEAPLSSDPKGQLLDYWAGRYGDPSFEAGLDALFARMGTAVPPEVRARIASSAASYRTAVRDADAMNTNDYTPAEKFDRLIKIDVEGKRLNLRAELEAALRGVGLLDRDSNPVAAEFLAFMRADLAAASKAFALDRGEKVRIDRALSETYWRAHQPTQAEAATFARLDGLNAELEDARDRLMASYLADSGGSAVSFVLKDRELDTYLKAQSAFDAELTRALGDKPSPAVVRALDGLYGLREALDRAVARAEHGRGMGALDALIMLEQARLRAARWTHATPARIDPIAAALSRLKETRERWASGKVGPSLEPLYAVTSLDGEGRRTWAVKEWLSAGQFDAMVKDGVERPGAPGAIIARGGGYFIDYPAQGSGKYEVVGGADAADAAHALADSKFNDNRVRASLQAKMASSDFVAPGEPGQEAMGWQFAQVFGSGGLHAQGRVLFFEASVGSKPARALHPLTALSRPPEEVVMKLYLGDKALGRDRFLTLHSLEDSEESAAFKTLTVSPKGASELIKHARDREAYSLRRGWIEVKLNSFGFARDGNGQVSQLYRTKDDFEAQWKAYDHAERDLGIARRDLKAAQAEVAARKEETDDSAKLKAARARAINASQTVRDAELTLARSRTETLHRSADLTLGLGSDYALVHVAAPGARGPARTKDLDEPVAGGGSQVHTISGSLLAAVVDQEGKLVHAYTSEREVDKGFKDWTLRFDQAGGDVVGGDAYGALTKVRFSHYEETVGVQALPVLLGATYLTSRLEGAQSALWTAKRWSYLPFNWGNIALEIPRGVAGLPAEFAGRDPLWHHYLGRASLYKTEGGMTEHNGFFRSVLGAIDVLNLLPDPAEPFYDPSQFPDRVHTGSALRPGEGLWSKDLSAKIGGREKDIHLGRQSLQREVIHAAEDLDAARVRTLSRFRGGVEQLTLETRRGRAGRYQESTRTAELGPEAIRRRLADGTIAADPLSGGFAEADVVTAETPGRLSVDSVERRVRVRPGADAYARQAAALDGYDGRAVERDRAIEPERAALEAVRALAEKKVAGTVAERDQARSEEGRLRVEWHQLAQRIGEQDELEKRVAFLKADIQALESRIAFWERYRGLLEGARRPLPPFAPNPMFWVWMLFLSLLGAAALALRRWRRRPPPPNPA